MDDIMIDINKVTSVAGEKKKPVEEFDYAEWLLLWSLPGFLDHVQNKQNGGDDIQNKGGHTQAKWPIKIHAYGYSDGFGVVVVWPVYQHCNQHRHT